MKLFIYGYGGLGLEVKELAVQINQSSNGIVWQHIHFVDDNPDVPKAVFSFEYLLKQFKDDNNLEVVVAIGEPSIRQLIFHKLVENGLPLATLVHPQTSISPTVKIGVGSVICFGSLVSHGTIIGLNSYIQPNCYIGHDNKINDHTVISPGVSTGGNVNIGLASFIGLNTSIRQGIVIGDNVIIGMGTSLTIPVEDNLIVAGNPAKIIAHNIERKVFR